MPSQLTHHYQFGGASAVSSSIIQTSNTPPPPSLAIKLASPLGKGNFYISSGPKQYSILTLILPPRPSDKRCNRSHLSSQKIITASLPHQNHQRLSQPKSSKHNYIRFYIYLFKSIYTEWTGYWYCWASDDCAF